MGVSCDASGKQRGNEDDVHASPVWIVLLTVWSSWRRGRSPTVLHGRTGPVQSGLRIRPPRTRHQSRCPITRRINATCRSLSDTGHAVSHSSTDPASFAAPTAPDFAAPGFSGSRKSLLLQALTCFSSSPVSPTCVSQAESIVYGYPPEGGAAVTQGINVST